LPASIDTANALADSLRSRYSEINTELVDITRMRSKKQSLRFTKMQSCGNDYIYFDCFKQTVESPESLAIALSDRHYGVGGDGVILIAPSDTADAKMRMFNLDGSEGVMCGNGIRCVAKYLFDNDIVQKRDICIETLGGVKTLRLRTKEGKVSSVSVDMGRASLPSASLPVRLDGERVIDRPVNVEGQEFRISCISIGNPHCVLFFDTPPEAVAVEKIGPLLENHTALFPERVNVEFAHLVDAKTIKLRVWERGSGETLACGTGACAAVAAAVENGFCARGEQIRVQLPGGDLYVRYTDDAVFLTGSAVKVFEGTMEI
jgi:carbamoyl-phosphate synthase large subunit